MSVSAESVREQLERYAIHTVRVSFMDNSGVVRARNVPAARFRETVLEEGLPIPPPMLLIPRRTSCSRPGPDSPTAIPPGICNQSPSLITLPYVPGSARVLADVLTLEGDPVESVPRRVLSRVLGNLADLGYTTRGAAEFEFYVFKSPIEGTPQPTWTGINCYAEVKQQQVDDILTALSTNLTKDWPGRRGSQYGVWAGSVRD